MLEKSDLSLFLSKLTILCREYGVELYAITTYSGSALFPLFPEKSKDWSYIATRSPFTDSKTDEWDILCLSCKHTETDLEDGSEICEADEHFIKVLEAGLE